jgi:UPF0716 protein FxsA
LTPGFVTDSLGLLLFLPPVRDALRAFLSRRLATRMETGIWVDGQKVRRGRTRREDVVDAEYRDISEERAETSDEESGKRLR